MSATELKKISMENSYDMRFDFYYENNNKNSQIEEIRSKNSKLKWIYGTRGLGIGLIIGGIIAGSCLGLGELNSVSLGISIAAPIIGMGFGFWAC